MIIFDLSKTENLKTILDTAYRDLDEALFLLRSVRDELEADVMFAACDPAETVSFDIRTALNAMQFAAEDIAVLKSSTVAAEEAMENN